MAGNPEVAQALLREAQNEIALLRTDLFNTRRLAEERRQGLDALQAERTQLGQQLEHSQHALAAANAQLNHVPELQQKCVQLEAQLRRLHSELDTSVAARRILEKELDDERRHRGALTDQKAVLESERARLAKQRDDLAAQVRLEQKKAREAEEEQVRAEEDCAGLRAELAALQAASAQAASAPQLAAATVSAAAASGHGASAADMAATIGAAVAAATTPLMEQVEHERNRAAHLLSNLHAAKNEIIELTQRLSEFESRHTDTLARGNDHEHLIHHVAQLQEDNAQLAKQLEAAQQHSAQLEAQAAELRQQLQQAQAAATAAAAAAASSHPPPPPAPAHPAAAPHRPSRGSQDGLPPPPARPLGDAGRAVSTSSLYHGVSGDGEGGPEEEAARLRSVVHRLKASRDKLLGEIDKQWEEIERLSADNAAMGEELRATRALAANWEAQAQDALARIDQLKDLLEDSARWGEASLGGGAGGTGVPGEQQLAQGGGAPAGLTGAGQLAGQGAPDGAQGTAAAGLGAEAGALVAAGAGAGGGPGGLGPSPSLHALQAELLGEKARSGELELQLRAVAAELLRTQHSSLELGRSFLPVLAGVEKRLGELCRKGSRGVVAVRNGA